MDSEEFEQEVFRIDDDESISISFENQKADSNNNNEQEVKATIAVIQQRAPLILGSFMSPAKKTPTLRRIGGHFKSSQSVLNQKQHIGHRQIIQYSADGLKEQLTLTGRVIEEEAAEDDSYG